jgi:formamidopyrimidine-DNA glycosylase
MPEGPEVRLSADLIRPLTLNKKIVDVSIGNKSRYKHENPEGYDDFQETLIHDDVKVDDISVRGKFMFWTFNTGWYLMNTFGMSGQWSPIEGKHPCLFVDFEDGTHIFFNDPRHFGTVKFTNNSREVDKKVKELGWDPLATPLDKNLKWVIHQLSRTSKTIAEVLMDQSLFCGVGNYIRAEALYLSRISPWRQCNKLTQDDVKDLCKAIVEVMKESYAHQGATIHTYKTAYGDEGKYSTLFKVYGQKLDPMGRKIIKQPTPDKRTIHWCPEVQV